MKEEIERGLSHMLETNQIRKVFWHMDERVEGLLYGIRQGDDAIVVGDTVVNMEGPYPLDIGRKTGLVHTCSDIVVMGGRPLYALNSMQVESIQQAREVAEDVKKQSNGLGVPIVGGNTQMENDLKPCISFTVVGKLETGVEVHASKDASRGGWFGNLAEMMVKSKRGVKITSIPYTRLTRYMGTYMISVPKREVERIVGVCAKNKCPVVEVGEVLNEPLMKMGGKIVVSEKKMTELIRKFPYHRPKA